MYGLIGSIKCVDGKREELIGFLAEGSADMPGCLSYVIARDSSEPDTVWVTEVWQNKGSHAASLSLPSVQQAIVKARPLIAGFGHRFETEPVSVNGFARHE